MSQRNIGELSVKIGGDVTDLQKAFKRAKSDLKSFQRSMESPEAAFIRKNMDALAMEKATAEVKAYNRELAKTKSTYKEIGQAVGSRLTRGIASLFDTRRVNWREVNRVMDMYKGHPVSPIKPFGRVGGVKELIEENTHGAGFKGALLNLKDGLVDTAKYFTQKLGDGIRSIGRGLRSGGASLREDFRPKNLLTSIGGGIGSVIGAGVSIGRGAISAVPGILSTSFDMIKGIGSFLLELPSKVLTVFSKLNPFEFLTQSFTQFKTIVVMGLGALTVQALRLHAEFEATEVGFASLVKSKSVARELVADIRELATSTPFRSKELLASGKLLLGYGTEAKNVIPILRMLGDVTAAIGGEYINLEHVTYLFGTLQQQGHAFTRDMNQFANIGIPIIPEVAKILKIRPEEVMGATEAGKVNFIHVAKAFQAMTAEGGHFYKFMEEKSKTLAGRWENFRDQAEIALARVGEMIAKEFHLKEFLSDASGGLKNIDNWIVKNRKEITEFFDIVKGIGTATGQVFLHIGAGFRVLFDIGQQLFPNTFAYMEKLIKQGKDWTLSWSEAKNNMIGIFESISVSFASMLDSIVNGFARASNAVIGVRRGMLGSGWSDKERGEFMTSQHQRLTVEVRQSYAAESGQLARLNEINAKDPTWQSVAADKFMRELALKSTKQVPSFKELGNEYDKWKGFGLFDADSSMKRDVQAFWNTFKTGMAETEAKRLAADKEYSDWYDKNLNSNRVLAANAVSPLGMMGQAFKTRQRNEEFVNAPIDQMKVLVGQFLGTGIARSIEMGMYYQAQDKNKILSGEWDTIQWNRDRKKDPNRKADFGYQSPVTHEMIEYAKKIKADLHPAADFAKHMEMIKTLGAEGYLNPDEQGKAIAEQMAKAKEALGIGFDNVKFADAIYKGTAEAVSLENKWMASSSLDSPLEIANAIAQQGVEHQKAMREYLRKISDSMPGQILEQLAMPREANQ